ncbi:MAG TPA: hypothetical protein VFS00_16335 [Polyangiaceae bacterium]|nr:hypothetical protein [Polyangiaceae bacterium]
MRFPFDELFKQLLLAAFHESDRVERNAELDAQDAQKVDVRLEPRPEGDAKRALAGLLGRLLGEGPCHAEYFAEAPSVEEVHETVRKLLTARQQRDRRTRLWLFCAGRPVEVLSRLGFARAPDAPGGVYRLAPGWATGLVVLRELPRTPDTLLLRLLTRGQTFTDTLQELVAMPHEAWERTLAEPVLVRLRFLDPAPHSSNHSRSETMRDPRGELLTEEEETALRQAMEIAYQSVQQRATEAGLKDGLKEGLERAFGVLARQFERRLGRPLDGRERAELRRRFDALGPDRLGDVVLDSGGDELAAWLADPKAE